MLAYNQGRQSHVTLSVLWGHTVNLDQYYHATRTPREQTNPRHLSSAVYEVYIHAQSLLIMTSFPFK